MLLSLYFLYFSNCFYYNNSYIKNLIELILFYYKKIKYTGRGVYISTSFCKKNYIFIE